MSTLIRLSNAFSKAVHIGIYKMHTHEENLVIGIQNFQQQSNTRHSFASAVQLEVQKADLYLANK